MCSGDQCVITGLDDKMRERSVFISDVATMCCCFIQSLAFFEHGRKQAATSTLKPEPNA